MSKARDRKVKARLLPEMSVETRAATVAVRPLRLAFLINIDAPEERLLKYLAYNSSIWGGIYNCLVPTDGESLTEDWWRVLRMHDPDRIVFCDPGTPALRKQIEDTVQPFAILAWSDDVAAQHSSGIDSFGSLTLRHLLLHIYKAEKPIPESKSNIRLPTYHDDSLYRVCAAAQLGVLDEELTSVYIEAFRADSIDLGQDDLQQYLEGLNQFSGRLSPLNMTKWNLSTSSEGGISPPGFNLVLLSEKWSVEAVCVFWNLRMTPEIVYKKSLLLPIEILKGSPNLRTLAEWCNENVRSTNHLNLVSPGVNKRRLVRLRDRLKPLLDNRFAGLDIWHAGFGISRFRAYETKQPQEVRIENRVFSLVRPAPIFGDEIRGNGEWVVDIDFRDRRRLGRGYIPPRYPRLSHLLSGEPSGLTHQASRGYSTRLAHDWLSFRVKRSTEHVKAQLPREEDLFASLLDCRGYSSHTTDKCRYTRGIIKLLGEYSDAHILRDSSVRELLYAMARGEAYSIGEMKSFLRPGAEESRHQEVDQLISDLALSGVFLRGYRILCPACDLTRWYRMHDVSETMQCAGCLSNLQPPIEAPFSYKLNELLVRGIEQGAIPLLLTILVLSTLGHESFLFMPGVEAQQHDSTVDIDLLAACNGHLVVAECKDLQEGCASESIQEIVGQLRNSVEIAADLGARLVFLSTLLDQSPTELQRGVDLIERRHSEITIRIILKADLERGYLTRPAGPPLAPADADRLIRIGLTDLLPRPKSRKEGWIREPGRRWVSA